MKRTEITCIRENFRDGFGCLHHGKCGMIVFPASRFNPNEYYCWACQETVYDE